MSLVIKALVESSVLSKKAFHWSTLSTRYTARVRAVNRSVSNTACVHAHDQLSAPRAPALLDSISVTKVGHQVADGPGAHQQQVMQCNSTTSNMLAMQLPDVIIVSVGVHQRNDATQLVDVLFAGPTKKTTAATG